MTEQQQMSTEIREEVLLSIGTTFAIQEDAIQNLNQCPWTDEEIAVLLTTTDEVRMRTTARLVELSELLRNSLRELDGRVLQLTDGQAR